MTHVCSHNQVLFSGFLLAELCLGISASAARFPVLGRFWGNSNVNIYQRLCVAAKKTRKQVFVSYSLPGSDPNMSLLVENRIKTELQLHPEHF